MQARSNLDLTIDDCVPSDMLDVKRKPLPTLKKYIFASILADNFIRATSTKTL